MAHLEKKGGIKEVVLNQGDFTLWEQSEVWSYFGFCNCWVRGQGCGAVTV